MSTANEIVENLQSSTPSRETKETPNWVRVVGLFGMAALLLSVFMYCWNAFKYITVLKGPTHIKGISAEGDVNLYSSFLIYVFFVLGIVLTLLQASKERDKTQRRIFGVIGTAIFCLGILLAANTLVAEAWRQWSIGPDAGPENLTSRGKWAGLLGIIVMSLILLTAWIAPFVRAASETTVSFFGLIGAWIRFMGTPLVSSCTLFGVIGVAALAAIAYLLRDPLMTYSEMILSYSKENYVPYGVGSYILLFLITGLPFMLLMANREDEEPWARMPTSIIGVIGVIAACIGLIGFCTDLFRIPDFTLPYGFTLSLLGLLFIIIFVTQRDADSTHAQILARCTGYAGLIVLVVAAVRSLLPAVVEIGWLQDMFPSLETLTLTAYLVPNGFVYMLVGALFLLIGRLYASESKLMILTRRELGGILMSPIGHIVLGATLVVAWFSYFGWVNDLSEAGRTQEPVVVYYFFGFIIIVFMMIAIPMLTMRLLSEENRSGTMEVLLTAPVDEFSIVISKFLAGWLYTVLIFLTWAIYPILLRIAGQEGFDYRPMMSAILGLSIVSLGFVAMGVFFSSISKNQIVALLLTFAGILTMMMFFFVEGMLTQGARANPNSPVIEFLRYGSFVHHLLFSFDFGKVEFKQILFHLSFAAFWLFLTIRVLESRKWR